MKKLITLGLLIPGLVMLTTGSAYAWGQNGHRITGKIAELHLSADAKAAIKELLGKEGLAEASHWPDFMRSSRDPFWKRSGPYHYVTVPKGKTYQEVQAPERGDAVTALKMFTKIVKDKKAPLKERQRALRFIVHLIGDLHQPLHAGNGTDRGANDIKVTFFDEETNLHSVWDTKIIESQNLSYTEYVNFIAPDITADQVKRWSVTDPLVWIAESTKIRDTIYPVKTRLWYNYIYDHRATVNKRLSMGGVRIAAYLNDIFKKTS